MPKYMSLFRYTAEATTGLLKDKASGREAAVKKAVESVGGRLESLYWITSGEYTGVVTCDLPDVASFAAFGTMVISSGALAEANGFHLLTSEEMDRALGKAVTYRPPGG